MLEFAAAAAGPLDLDTKGLHIDTVRCESGAVVPWELGEDVAVLGRRLRLMLPPGTRAVTLRYAASPDAVGLQWLSPAQTEGKRHPFLFSQFQPIHARTMVPLQDSPRARVTYHAEVTVPEPLSAVMSAGPAGVRPGPRAWDAHVPVRHAAADPALPAGPRRGGAREPRPLASRAGVGRARHRRRGRLGVRRDRAR